MCIVTNKQKIYLSSFKQHLIHSELELLTCDCQNGIADADICAHDLAT